MTATRRSYAYFVVRCVPRVEREEFVNVGVVLYCQATGFLGMAWSVNAARLEALHPAIDLDDLVTSLSTMQALCSADATAGPLATLPAAERFGWLAAPRSTVVQPGPIHAGLTPDPQAELDRLVGVLAS